MTQLQRSHKTAVYLLEFSWGDPAAPETPVRLTDWTADFPFQGDLFLSDPRIEVKLPVNSGGLEEKALEILVPTDVDPLFADLAREAHADVEVSVIELLGADEVSPEPRIVFVGTLTEVDENHKDVDGQTLVIARSVKSELRTSMGIAANSQCGWNTFGFACGLFEADFEDTGGTVLSITGKTVAVTGLAVASTVTYYNQGWLKKDGLRIKIRDWVDTAPTIFHLVRRPPTAWLSAAVSAVAGDDKLHTTCLTVFNNLDRFMGNGVGIPAWSPTFEAP